MDIHIYIHIYVYIYINGIGNPNRINMVGFNARRSIGDVTQYPIPRCA